MDDDSRFARVENNIGQPRCIRQVPYGLETDEAPFEFAQTLAGLNNAYSQACVMNVCGQNPSSVPDPFSRATGSASPVREWQRERQ